MDTLGFIKWYIQKCKISGRIKIWITGYSRAGATANLVAGTLDDRGFNIGDTVTYAITDVYAYCFEAPAGVHRATIPNIDLYINIFNILNLNDPVVRVPPNTKNWGYSRYGIDKYLPSALTHPDYSVYLLDMEHIYNQMESVDEYIIDSKFKMKKIDLKFIEIVNDEKNRLNQILFLDGFFSLLFDEIIKGTEDYTNEYERNIRTALIYFYSLDNSDKIIKRTIELFNEKKADMLKPPLTLDATAQKIAAIIRQVLAEEHLTYFDDDLVSISESITKLIFKLLSHPNYSITLMSNIDCLIQAHYPELCLAYMQSIKSTDDKAFTDGRYTQVFFNCPVDIDVYDRNQNLIASIVDDVPQIINDSTIISLVDNDEQKVICLPINGEYTFYIKARDFGSVNISFQLYDSDIGDVSRIANYYNIGVSAGDILTANIKQNEESFITCKVLGPTGNEIHLSEELCDKEIVDYIVNVDLQGEGSVIGTNRRKKGKFIKLQAFSSEGYVFDGWYDSEGKLLEKSDIYRFKVLEDVDIIARFMPIASKPDITSVSVTTPILVETCAAYLNITITGENIGGKIVNVYFQVGDEHLYETRIINNNGRMYITKASQAGTYKIVILVNGIISEKTCAITVVEYNTNIWESTAYILNGKLYVSFNADITLKQTSNCVTINDKLYDAKVLTDKRTIEIIEFYPKALSSISSIKITGVKYPILFPSYSFTFMISLQ